MMIFKRLLQPKWQHPDSAKRIEAIQQLVAEQSDYKKILHELAFNDGSSKVRQAALEKLNDFSLWWQASKKEPSERLRLEAENRVVQMVITNQISLRLKQQFIEQCQRSSVLEQILRMEQDSDIKLNLLQRLNKQELYCAALHDETLALTARQNLLLCIQDDKELERLHKSLQPELAELVAQLLSKRQQQRELPAKLRKQASLIVSKINALKDRNPPDSESRFRQYQQEWLELTDALRSLDDWPALEEKYQQLQSSVQAFFASSWQQAKQQQAAEDKQQQQQLLSSGIRKAIAALEIDLRQSLANTNLQQAEQLQSQFYALQEQLQQAELAAAEQLALQETLAKLEQQLVDLPRVALRFGQAEQWLQQWREENLPSQVADIAKAKQQLQDWQQCWQQLSADLSLPLPSELNQSFAVLSEQWQSRLESLERTSQQPYRQCRSKLHEFKRLHQAGKFKVLFGLFKGIEQDYQQLLPEQQQQLDTLYQQARQQLEALSDLQAFIATPRKQQLLQQMQQLAEEPMLDASQRSAEVKRARSDWLSLGKVKEDEAANWQQLFDDACERAFAPCRAFFATQQAEREHNLKQKQALLSRLQQLAAADDSKDLAQTLQQLQQEWQRVGQVPKEAYTALQHSYQQQCRELWQRVKHQQAGYAASKQQLIAEVKAAMQLSDTGQAAAILKQCQLQWKQIPFAGKTQDAELWRAFRALCDDFFAKRKSEHQELQQQRQQEQQQCQQQLTACEHELQQSEQPQQLSVIRQQLLALDLSSFASLSRMRQQLLEQLEQKQQQFVQHEQQQWYHQLFTALQSGASMESLPGYWRDALAQQADNMSRADLTIILELVSTGQVQDATVPAQHISALKLQLLAEKHNQSSNLTKENLLKRWLSHGTLQPDETVLLSRVAALFTAS